MHLVKYKKCYEKNINDYQLQEDQLHFPKTPSYHINQSCQDENCHCILGFDAHDQLVTFFVLDRNSDYLEHFATNPQNTVIFRSFSTDMRYLRKGYAKSCIKSLNHYIKNNLSDIHYIALVVNETNEVSYNIYKCLGFHKTGQIITTHGVKQYLMQKEIH